MNDIYHAIFKAADSIERNPHLYDFWQNDITDCGSPHCILGWVGVHLGIKGKDFEGIDAVKKTLGLGTFGALTALGWKQDVDGDWHDAKHVSQFLRKFAQRYKGSHTGLPDVVRDIFKQPETARPTAGIFDEQP